MANKMGVYMPVMIGDWLKGTKGMKAEVRGVYLNLLLYQWDNGHLPSDIEDLRLIEPEIDKVWISLKCKFEEFEPGKLRNKKNDEVKNFFQKQKKNGEKGGRKPKSEKKENPNNNPNSNPNSNLHNMNYEYDIEINNDSFEKGAEKTFENKLFDVDLLLEKVLLDKDFPMPFEQQGMPPDKLRKWLKNFNLFLRHGGEPQKTEKDYRWHFTNWIPGKDLQHPENYSTVKDLKNGRTQNNSNTFARTPAGSVSGSGGY